MKRATSNLDFVLTISVISIHALMKRATSAIKPLVNLVLYFNPRPHEEGDVHVAVSLKLYAVISIHALMKRATCTIHPLQCVQLYFNPRPHEEGDRALQPILL